MGKSGFDDYKTSAKSRVKAKLQEKQPKGGRPTQEAVAAELGKRWDRLPDSSRNIWNRQAS